MLWLRMLCSKDCIPANSHALGVSLTPASWKLQSHANSRLRTKCSHLLEKCELLQLELKHFPKRCKLTPIRETKTPCNWKSKWVPDVTYPKSPISMISDKKSIGNEVVFSVTLPWTGSERCPSEVFGSLRICSCRLRKSWYPQVKNLTPLTQKKLAGINGWCVRPWIEPSRFWS